MRGKQKMIVAAVLSTVVAVAIAVMPTRASAQDWNHGRHIGWGDHDDGWRGGPGWHGGGPPPWSHGRAWGGGPGWQNNQWGGGDHDGDDGYGYGARNGYGYGNGYGWNNGQYDNPPYNYGGAYNGYYGNGYNQYYGQSPAMNAIGSIAGPLLGLPIP